MKFNKEFKLFESKYDIIDLQILYRDEKRIKAKFEGVAKPMVEKGFNKKQIEQIAIIVTDIVTKIIDEKVPGIVKNIVEPEFKKINNRLDVLEQDVNQLKQDVKAIKSCPTIQKELSLVQ